MKITITVGTGGCQHVTITDASTSKELGVYTRSQLKAALKDFSENNRTDDALLTRICQVLQDAVTAGTLTSSSTLAQKRTFLQSVEL